MKIIVRALALGMLLTGFAADHMLAKATPTTATTIQLTSSAVPMPMCEPGRSTCGM